MSLGALENEGDLLRWLEKQLQTPGVMPQQAQSPIALTKAGVPADSDFPHTPGNGIFALDSTGPTLYVRINGTWEPL